MAKKTTRTRKAAVPAGTPNERFLNAAIAVGEAGIAQRPMFSAHAAVRAFASWAFAAASLNATACAATPLRMYVRKPRGAEKLLWRTRAVPRWRRRFLDGETHRTPSVSAMRKLVELGGEYEEVVESHEAVKLLHVANPWLNGFDMTTWRFLSLQQHGNAYVYALRDGPGDTPTELWPMPAQWTEVVPGGEGLVSEYVFGRNRGQGTRFSRDEVIQAKMPGLASLYWGTGYAEAAWAALTLHAANHDLDLGMAQNRGRPDYLLIANGTGATADALDRFESKVRERLVGPRKGGKWLTVTGQVDLKPLSFPPKDMAGRDEIVEEIAAIYRVPVSMLKANDPNLASATAGYATWRETSILPLCRLDEEALNQCYLPMWDLDGDVVFAYDDPVPANADRERADMTAGFAVGKLTPNELRIADGLEPLDLPGMDEPWIGGRPVSQAAAPPPPPTPPGFGFGFPAPAATRQEAPPAPQPAEEPKNACGCGKKHDATPATPKAITGRHVKSVRWKAAEGEEIPLFRQVRDILDRQKREAIEAMIAAGQIEAAAAAIRAVLSDPKWRALIVEAVAEQYRQVIAAGAEAGVQSLGSVGVDARFDVLSEQVEEYIQQSATRLANELGGTTATDIESLIGEGVRNGESINEINQRIQASHAFSTQRADMIARTETANAFTQGQLEAWDQSGIIGTKTWVLSPEPCEFCEAVSRNGTIPLKQPYANIGDTITGADGGTMTVGFRTIQGPPLHPYCLCDVVGNLIEDDE
jgi:HK97 family phage portal protein